MKSLIGFQSIPCRVKWLSFYAKIRVYSSLEPYIFDLGPKASPIISYWLVFVGVDFVTRVGI